VSDVIAMIETQAVWRTSRVEAQRVVMVVVVVYLEQRAEENKFRDVWCHTKANRSASLTTGPRESKLSFQLFERR
jgi:hypothetical protein